MKRQGKLLLTIGTFLVFFGGIRPAQAYIDPGTGSYLLQLMAAGLLAGAFTIKLWWGKVKAFISKILGKREK